MSDSNNDTIKHPPVERDESTQMPEVNTLTFNDIVTCLKQGLKDFTKAPLFGLFFGGFYAVGGIIIVQSLFVWDKTWFIYPIMIGFPLIGPFVAVGLYEVSRRLSANLPLAWNEILALVWVQSGRELRWMAFVMLFIFWIWMYQVRLLLALFLGNASFPDLQSFIEIITTTTQGIMFIMVGHVVGAFLAMVLFSVTVVSIPLLLDREVDIITAMITSVKAVLQSPVVMFSWGIFVTLAVMASFIPAFLGLLIVLPILGHTTWHIYKKAVV